MFHKKDVIVILFLSAVLMFFFNYPLHAAELKVCLVSGAPLYDSGTSLEKFKQHLEERYFADCTLLQSKGKTDLPGLEALEQCDVALFFTRRLEIDGDQLAHIKKYCESGNPIVAVRTASHGFQNWLEFDKLVLGGNYHGHYKNGPTTNTEVVSDAKEHPILNGVGKLKSRSSLYQASPLAGDTQLLLTGKIPGEEPEPVAWTRVHNGGRVFYTSLGSPEDFKNSAFKKMIANALFWAANREVEAKELQPLARRSEPTGILQLPLRSRIELFKGSNIWNTVYVHREFPIAETAIVICDMWDQHWCSGASERCEALAIKMNDILKIARDRGIQIIHAPSDTLAFYADWPQRRRMMLAPKVPLPELLNLPTHKLPIDDSDGGCDTAEKPWYSAWTRQSSHIEIGKYDGISDNGNEIYNFFRQEGITNMLIMGVHTNMCVLGRSFGIRNMTRLGIQCVLVRDLTDTMYDPKDWPYVSHHEGTELVVEHIEKYWCPTVHSSELLAGLPEE